MEGNIEEIEHYIYMSKMATKFQWLHFVIGIAGGIFCTFLWGSVIIVFNVINILHLEKRKNKFKHIIGQLVVEDLRRIFESSTKAEQEIIRAFVKENYGEDDET